MTLADGEFARLRALPKTEFHVHLEGSMSVETAREPTGRHDLLQVVDTLDGHPFPRLAEAGLRVLSQHR